MTTTTEFMPLNCAILTVSDTRTTATDRSGDTIANALIKAKHNIAARNIIKDDLKALRGQFAAWVSADNIHVIISTGGTGFAGRDVTPEAAAPLITRSIPGFGELFRWLSYSEIGSSTILSRAEAGFADKTLLFLLPGSTGACRLAMENIIIEQIDIRHRPCNLAQQLSLSKKDEPAHTH